VHQPPRLSPLRNKSDFVLNAVQKNTIVILIALISFSGMSEPDAILARPETHAQPGSRRRNPLNGTTHDPIVSSDFCLFITHCNRAK
jgi:hypothetical protein